MSEYVLPFLDKLVDNGLHTNRLNKVICYHVNYSGKYPFIQFMLYNNGTSLSLPCLDRNITTTTDIFVDEISSALDLHLETDKHKIKLKGFLDDDNDDSVRYFFVDISGLSNINGLLLQHDTAIWFGLLSELINNKQVYDVVVDKDVCDFFTDHYELFVLHNPSTGLKYPLPDVGYHGSHFKMTEFQNEFGINKQKRKLGDYFYYTYALQDAIDWNNENQEYVASIFMGGGVNRIALLADNMLYLNEEEIDKQQDYESYISGLMEIHDSIFVYSKHKSFILMKDIQRQVSLSYHKIDEPFNSCGLYTVD